MKKELLTATAIAVALGGAVTQKASANEENSVNATESKEDTDEKETVKVELSDKGTVIFNGEDTMLKPKELGIDSYSISEIENEITMLVGNEKFVHAADFLKWYKTKLEKKEEKDNFKELRERIDRFNKDYGDETMEAKIKKIEDKIDLLMKEKEKSIKEDEEKKSKDVKDNKEGKTEDKEKNKKKSEVDKNKLPDVEYPTVDFNKKDSANKEEKGKTAKEITEKNKDSKQQNADKQKQQLPNTDSYISSRPTPVMLGVGGVLMLVGILSARKFKK